MHDECGLWRDWKRQATRTGITRTKWILDLTRRPTLIFVCSPSSSFVAPIVDDLRGSHDLHLVGLCLVSSQNRFVDSLGERFEFSSV